MIFDKPGIEYNVMTRDDLTNYIFKFWCGWGASELDERDDTEIKGEIFNNLGTEEGIERELDCLREEFDSGWDEDSLEYENLNTLWNYINWYKTDFYNKEGE